MYYLNDIIIWISDAARLTCDEVFAAPNTGVGAAESVFPAEKLKFGVEFCLPNAKPDELLVGAVPVIVKKTLI